MKFVWSHTLMFGFFRKGTGPGILGAEILDLLCSTGEMEVSNAHLGWGNESNGQTTDVNPILGWLKETNVDAKFEIELRNILDKSKRHTLLLGNWFGDPSKPPSPVVHLYMDGEAFWKEGVRSPARDGKVALNRFAELCTKLRPTYAAIVQTYELDSPMWLVEHPKSHGFYDFYLGSDLPEKLIVQAKSLYQGAYISDMESGVYISTTKWFNPKALGIKAEDLSAELGRKIGHILQFDPA